MTVETDLMEWPTTRPLTRWSWMVRLYWWLIFLFPPLALLAAWDSARTARSADEALGLTFFVAPFLLVALVIGPALAYRAWISPAITRGERIVLVVLGLSAVAFILLVAQICDDFGGWPRGRPHPTRPLTLALTASWAALAIAARRKLHHGIPALWPRLWWILLLPAPPISFFLAVANLFPSKPTDDPSPYPLWPFLAGGVAALPLLAYRALLSPTVTRIEHPHRRGGPVGAGVILVFHGRLAPAGVDSVPGQSRSVVPVLRPERRVGGARGGDVAQVAQVT